MRRERAAPPRLSAPAKARGASLPRNRAVAAVRDRGPPRSPHPRGRPREPEGRPREPGGKPRPRRLLSPRGGLLRSNVTEGCREQPHDDIDIARRAAFSLHPPDIGLVQSLPRTAQPGGDDADRIARG